MPKLPVWRSVASLPTSSDCLGAIAEMRNPKLQICRAPAGRDKKKSPPQAAAPSTARLQQIPDPRQEHSAEYSRKIGMVEAAARDGGASDNAARKKFVSPPNYC